MQDPYTIVYSRYITEKAKVLENLKSANSNKCLKRCKAPKYVFLVNKKANKFEIAKAVETIYADKKVKVKKVNTILMKPRKVIIRGRLGHKAGFKKAIVTLRDGDAIE